MCSSDLPPDHDRLRLSGVKVRRRKKGSTILICPQSENHFRLRGTTKQIWVARVMEQLNQNTDRPIKVHEKAKGVSRPGYSEHIFYRALSNNIHAVVVDSSMAGIQAALFGVPCLVTDWDSTVANFGNFDFSQIESLELPEDRVVRAAQLANSQWTLHEIESGLAWENLKRYCLDSMSL